MHNCYFFGTSGALTAVKLGNHLLASGTSMRRHDNHATEASSEVAAPTAIRARASRFCQKASQHSSWPSTVNDAFAAAPAHATAAHSVESALATYPDGQTLLVSLAAFHSPHVCFASQHALVLEVVLLKHSPLKLQGATNRDGGFKNQAGVRVSTGSLSHGCVKAALLCASEDLRWKLGLRRLVVSY